MENNNQNSQLLSDIQNDDSGPDLKNILYTFLQYWYWFLAAVVLCLLAAFLYLRYTTPVYNVSSKILIKDDKGGGSGGSSDDLLSQMDIFSTKNNVNNEKQILQTHYVIEKVVNALQLNVSCFTVGNLKSTELYKNSPFKIQITYLKDSTPAQTFNLKPLENGRAFTIYNDNFKRKYQLYDTVKTRNVSFVVLPSTSGVWNDNGYKIKISTPFATTEKYLKVLSFSIDDKQASVISVTLQETVPGKGEDILNKLYEVYTSMNEEDKNKIADSTINFIDERLAVVSNQLAGVENDIEQFKVKNQVSTDLPEQARLALGNVNDIQQQLTTQDVQISVVQSIEDHLKGNNSRVVPNAAVIQDPTYITTVQEYNALVLERDRQLQTTKPDNPVIQNLNSQINAVKSNLLITLENIKRQMQISRNELANKNAQLLGQIRSGPAKERAIADISRQQNVQEQLYLYLLQKREETAISKSGTLANSRLIEPAKTDPIPASPNKPIFYLAALCAGILLPSGIIYFRNLLNNTVTDVADITKETDVPVIGQIGHNTSGKTLVAEQNSRTALAEQFRVLRTNLQFLSGGKDKQVVMLTSSNGGEGKSFLSINLGSTLAISNKKVVLVELDLRKPKISKELGLSTERGFTDYLIGKYKKEEIIKPTSIHPNLFLISAGTIPPNPAELLLYPEVDELFVWLRTRFDYIIIDTAPAGLVIDAVLLGKYADSSIYVVRQSVTLKGQLRIINDFKQNRKLPNITVLLNDVQINKTNGYKYGYSYGNGYGNGYGNEYGNGHTSDYYSDNKKKKRFTFSNKS
jgi:tyrosine-protein kinase Etk/Wzc